MAATRSCSGSRRGRRTPAARRRGAGRVRQAPEDDRGLEGAGCRRVAAGRPADSRASQTKRVSFPRVLDAGFQHLAAVELRRQPGAERGPGLVGSATMRTASAVLAAETTSAPRRRSRRKRAHWRARLGMRDDALDRSSGESRAGDQAVADRVHHLADDLTSSVSNTSASSVALTEPSTEFSIGTNARSARPSCDRHHAVVDRRQRHRLDPSLGSAEASSASSLKVPSGPEEGDPHGRLTRSCRAWAGGTLAAPASGRAVRIASSSSGDSSNSGWPVAHALHVQARLVAVQDRGQHDARARARRAAPSSSTGGRSSRCRRRSGSPPCG